MLSINVRIRREPSDTSSTVRQSMNNLEKVTKQCPLTGHRMDIIHDRLIDQRIQYGIFEDSRVGDLEIN